MNKKIFSTILLSIMTLTFFSGCSSSSNDSDIIKIGGIGPLSGDAATYGTSVKEGAELYLEEINNNGGIDGKKIKLIFEDDQADPNSAKQAFNKLVDKDGVCSILGAVTSGATLAIAPDTTNKNIPMITPSATEPTITKVGGEFMFRGCFIDSFQGEILARYAKDTLDKKTAAVLYNAGSDYSKGIADAFKKEFEDNGGKVVQFLSYNDGDTDFKAQLTKINSSSPEVLILPDYYNVVGLIAKQAREMGIDSQFLGGDGWESEDLIKIGGDAIDGALYINHYFSEDDTEVVKNFVTSYKEKYNKEPDAFAALGYDTFKCLVTAIDDADSTDPKKIRDALSKVTLDSVTGSISFDENRSAIKSACIIKINGDKKVLADKVNP